MDFLEGVIVSGVIYDFLKTGTILTAKNIKDFFTDNLYNIPNEQARDIYEKSKNIQRETLESSKEEFISKYEKYFDFKQINSPITQNNYGNNSTIIAVSGSGNDFNFSQKKNSKLSQLIEKFERNKQENPDFEKLSQELTHYLQRKIEKDNPKLARDLRQKLIDGNREFIIETAIESKSKIHRKIAKYGLFKTANEVFIFLLSNILSIFQYQIKEKILSKEFSNHQIDDFITERIINPLWEDCQMSSLFDSIDEMYGLLFLLTGNCHIDWDNEV